MEFDDDDDDDDDDFGDDLDEDLKQALDEHLRDASDEEVWRARPKRERHVRVASPEQAKRLTKAPRSREVSPVSEAVKQKLALKAGQPKNVGPTLMPLSHRHIPVVGDAPLLEADKVKHLEALLLANQTTLQRVTLAAMLAMRKRVYSSLCLTAAPRIQVGTELSSILWKEILRPFLLEKGFVATNEAPFGPVSSSSVDVIHSVIAKVNMFKEIRQGKDVSHAEVHTTVAYPFTIAYARRNVTMEYCVQKWNSCQIPQHSFPKEAPALQYAFQFFEVLK